MTQFEDFPPEIFLQIVGELVLPALIAARGVCRRWRDILHPDCRDIPLTRRRLLRLYFKLLQSSSFMASRSDILPRLRSFDREAFVASLPESTPEEFHTWILEWPARAVFGWVWPGLTESHPIAPSIIPSPPQESTIGVGKQRILNAQLAQGRIPRTWLSVSDADGQLLWQAPQVGPQWPARAVQLLVLAVRPRMQELFSGLDVASYIALMLCPTKEDRNCIVRFSIAQHAGGVNSGLHAPTTRGGWIDFLEADLGRQERGGPKGCEY